MPFVETRTQASIFYTIFSIPNLILLQNSLVGLYSSKEDFEDSLVPFIQEMGLVGISILGFACGTAIAAIAAFLATLRLTKTVDMKNFRILVIVMIFFILGDGIIGLYDTFTSPDVFEALHQEGYAY